MHWLQLLLKPLCYTMHTIINIKSLMLRIETCYQKFADISKYILLAVFISSFATPILRTQVTYALANPLGGSTFYINNTQNNAATQATAWRNSRPADAAYMDRIALQPQAYWMGNWTANVQSTSSDYITRAQSIGKLGIIVAYNIPNRDCGSYSAGGASSYINYKAWIDSMASGIGGRQVIVILEPDALAQLDCLDAAGRNARLDALNYSVTKLKSSGGIVYLDIGNKGWLSTADAASRLQQGGIANANGFAINISNFYTSNESSLYGTDISNKLGGKHFIIDTSRNGLGSNGIWCNPSGRALGMNPTSSTQSTLIDAYLWIKGPGESDGTCNGGPSAGTWWPEYALGLAQNASTGQTTYQAPTASTTPAQPSATSAPPPKTTKPTTVASATVAPSQTKLSTTNTKQVLSAEVTKPTTSKNKPAGRKAIVGLALVIWSVVISIIILKMSLKSTFVKLRSYYKAKKLLI
jgi:endoglucanase